VGLIPERLDQEVLRRLAHWYTHGCASGRQLLLNAPIFDTLLQQIVEAAVHRGRPLCGHRAVFAHGLALAVHLREGQETPGDGSGLVAFSFVLEALGGPAVDQAMAAGPETDSPEQDPTTLLRRLERLDPRITLILRTIERLENGLGGSLPFSIEGVRPVHPGPRLAFFAGLLAGGVEFDLCPCIHCEDFQDGSDGGEEDPERSDDQQSPPEGPSDSLKSPELADGDPSEERT
jgi:hypothetical protein